MVDVPTRWLSDVLAEHGYCRVDVLSIDTEGTELEAWQTFPRAIWPRVIFVEWNTAGLPGNQQELVDTFTKQGPYMLSEPGRYALDCVLGGNLVFVRAV